MPLRTIVLKEAPLKIEDILLICSLVVIFFVSFAITDTIIKFAI